MVKLTFLLFGCFCISFAWCQPAPSIKTSVKDTSSRLQAEVSAGKEALLKKPPATELIEVLFATNEDCDLFVDEEFKTVVSKNQYQYVKLSPGDHSYKAKSKSTASELKEAFKVSATQSNEIFIDLLYAIDENNLKAQNALVNASDTGNLSEGSESSEQLKKATVAEILSSMVAIKGGNFIMGNNRSPLGDEIEHPVTVSPVMFSKYEVTQQQWQNVMGSNPSENKECSTCPVENISWEEAMKFIRKINVISNRRFRLPTEAEWEYVAKMGGKSEIDSAGGQEEYIKKTAWYFANSDKKTHPVGEKQPNVLGIYDLYGNVSEWCSDWYASYYYKDDDSQKRPEGPPLGKEKIIRGGSFIEYMGDRFRPSLRNKLKPTTKTKDVGFRLVLDVY